jgi:mono/diheme cytochrome c family protein
MGLSESQIDDVVAYLQTLGVAPDMDVIAATEVE